jgi:hypothetical protein
MDPSTAGFPPGRKKGPETEMYGMHRLNHTLSPGPALGGEPQHVNAKQLSHPYPDSLSPARPSPLLAYFLSPRYVISCKLAELLPPDQNRNGISSYTSHIGFGVLDLAPRSSGAICFKYCSSAEGSLPYHWCLILY